MSKISVLLLGILLTGGLTLKVLFTPYSLTRYHGRQEIKAAFQLYTITPENLSTVAALLNFVEYDFRSRYDTLVESSERVEQLSKYIHHKELHKNIFSIRKLRYNTELGRLVLLDSRVRYDGFTGEDSIYFRDRDLRRSILLKLIEKRYVDGMASLYWFRDLLKYTHRSELLWLLELQDQADALFPGMLAAFLHRHPHDSLAIECLLRCKGDVDGFRVRLALSALAVRDLDPTNISRLNVNSELERLEWIHDDKEVNYGRIIEELYEVRPGGQDRMFWSVFSRLLIRELPGINARSRLEALEWAARTMQLQKVPPFIAKEIFTTLASLQRGHFIPSNMPNAYIPRAMRTLEDRLEMWLGSVFLGPCSKLRITEIEDIGEVIDSFAKEGVIEVNALLASPIQDYRDTAITLATDYILHCAYKVLTSNGPPGVETSRLDLKTVIIAWPILIVERRKLPLATFFPTTCDCSSWTTLLKCLEDQYPVHGSIISKILVKFELMAYLLPIEVRQLIDSTLEDQSNHKST